MNLPRLSATMSNRLRQGLQSLAKALSPLDSPHFSHQQAHGCPGSHWMMSLSVIPWTYTSYIWFTGYVDHRYAVISVTFDWAPTRINLTPVAVARYDRISGCATSMLKLQTMKTSS